MCRNPASCTFAAQTIVAKASHSLIACAILLAVLLVPGCKSSSQDSSTSSLGKRPPNSATPSANTDPCASRLHDICGSLLLYYTTNHRLPAKLEELQPLPGFEEAAELICPVSGKPYVYEPAGIIAKEPGARVILYDPAPSHDGLRWAVSIVEPSGGGPLVTKVISLPESYFPHQAPR